MPLDTENIDMVATRLKECLATVLVAALAAMALPAFASPAPATLQGTVLAAETPLAGAVVIVSDADGARLATATTSADGSFSVGDVPAGVHTLGVETAQGAFEVAAPITLAPGETKGVHLAVRQAKDDDKKKKKKGAAYVPTAGTTAAMIVTIVGFAVMVGLAVESLNDDNTALPPASPSNPD